MDFVTLPSFCKKRTLDPATPTLQRLQAWHNVGLGSFPFARRYLGNHFYFLLLRVLRCFSSPRWPHCPMYSDRVEQVLSRPGFPIQKSPDQSLFSNSPKLIAAFHVFLRLLTPRHPPFALSSLATKMFYLYKFDKTLNVLFSAISICQRTIFFATVNLSFLLPLL